MDKAVEDTGLYREVAVEMVRNDQMRICFKDSAGRIC